MINPLIKEAIPEESNFMTFKSAVAQYDLGNFPDYILENYGDKVICVFEKDVNAKSLEIDALFLSDSCSGVVFLKNLSVDGFFIQEETDYGPLVVVMGNFKAKNIFVGGGDCYFRGRVEADQTLVAGVYNHGELNISGIIEAELILSFDHSFTYVRKNIRKGIVLGLSPSIDDPEFQRYEMQDVLERKYYLASEDFIYIDKVLKALRIGLSLLKSTVILTPLEKRLLKAKQSNPRKADLSGLSLKAIPKAVFELADLTEINLSFNYISDLPEALAGLTQLEKIKLMDCEFQQFPDVLLRMQTLTEIDLSKNAISVLPEALANLPNLKRISLYKCHLTSFPEVLYELKSLEALDLSYQEETPGLVIDKPLPKLKILNLSNSFGASIQAPLPNLQKLNMRNCSLKAFPEQIKACKKLKSLDLSLNRNIPAFPVEIADFQNLEELCLSLNYHKPDNFEGWNALPKLKQLLVQFPGHAPDWFLDILKIEQWSTLLIEGNIESPAIWREILKRKSLKKLAKVNQFGEEVLDIEKGRKQLKVV